MSDSIYQSQWEDAPLEVRKDMMLLMLRSQSSLIIRIGFYICKILCKVDLETFVDVVLQMNLFHISYKSPKFQLTKTAHRIFTLTLSFS